MFKLHLIRNDHQSNFGRLILGHTINQFEQSRIVTLLEVDHGILPECITTELERESRLTNTGRPLDVQVMDVPRGEIKTQSPFLQVRLQLLGRLVRHLVFITFGPLIQPQQARRPRRPTGGNGRMLIAPLGEVLAAVDRYSLGNTRRQAILLGGGDQLRQPLLGAGAPIRRATGHHDEPAAVQQGTPGKRLPDLSAQPTRLPRRPGFELPARMSGAKPRIWRFGTIRPSVAALVRRAGLGVDQIAWRTTSIGLRPQQLAHQLVQVGPIQSRD